MQAFEGYTPLIVNAEDQGCLICGSVLTIKRVIFSDPYLTIMAVCKKCGHEKSRTYIVR